MADTLPEGDGKSQLNKLRKIVVVRERAVYVRKAAVKKPEIFSSVRSLLQDIEQGLETAEKGYTDPDLVGHSPLLENLRCDQCNDRKGEPEKRFVETVIYDSLRGPRNLTDAIEK